MDLHYWRFEVDKVAEVLDDDTDERMKKTTTKKDRKRFKKTVMKSQRKNSLRALDKLTDIVDGRRTIVSDPPLVVRIDDMVDRNESDDLNDFFGRYLLTLPRYRRLLIDRFSIVDIAHKVVGVGSVGTRCLIVLLESGDGEPLFLQFKEATASVLEPYTAPSEFEPGERVVLGQRLTQTMGDIFLGWSHTKDPDGNELYFYFRQLWDGKGSADVDGMGSRRLRRYGRLCGAVLALSHARSGDAAMLAGYVGGEETFDYAVLDFANGYAELTEVDHAAHLDAISSGKVEAVEDIRS